MDDSEIVALYLKRDEKAITHICRLPYYPPLAVTSSITDIIHLFDSNFPTFTKYICPLSNPSAT